MTNETVLTIFRNIANGVGGHGSFLRNLADTVRSADSENLNVMMPFLVYIIVKYKLTEKGYTDNT